MSITWTSEDGALVHRTFMYPYDVQNIFDFLNGLVDQRAQISLVVPRASFFSKAHHAWLRGLASRIRDMFALKSFSLFEGRDTVARNPSEWAEILWSETRLGKELFGDKFNGLQIGATPNFLPYEENVIIVNSNDRDTVLDGVVRALTTGKTRISAPGTLIIVGEAEFTTGNVSVITLYPDDIVGPVPDPELEWPAVIISSGALNLRESPSGAVIVSMPGGAEVFVLDKVQVLSSSNYPYLKIRYNDTEGWAWADKIRYT